MNCLKVSKPESGTTQIRSWSSSHVDSVGDSSHSRLSTESQEQWRKIRLQQIMYRSVIQNDLNMVIRCIKHGGDVMEEYTPYFQTALHESARRGYLRMTELLLRAGANPNVIDEKAFLPLHYACQEGHFNTVKCLLLYGSMVTVENEYGDAPIHTATRYGHFDLLPLLLSVDLRRDFDTRPIPDKYERQEHINLQNANGDTCLHIAAALDRKNIVKRLLQWGANQAIANNQELTAMQVALQKQKVGIVKLLKNPPTIIKADRPSYANQITNGNHSDYPFKNFEGLQRYSDEIARHRLEHEGVPRSLSDPAASKALSSDNLSQSLQADSSNAPPLPREYPFTAAEQDHRGNGNNLAAGQGRPGLDEPDQSRSEDSISRAAKTRRHVAAVGQRVLPTKLIELEPQPNNTNSLGEVGSRVSRLQSHPGNNFAYNRNPLGKTIPVSIDDLDPSFSEKVDRRFDALSLEVDQKLRSLRSQYHDLERREEILRKSVKKHQQREKSKSPAKRGSSGGRSAEIKVTYENGNLIDKPDYTKLVRGHLNGVDKAANASQTSLGNKSVVRILPNGTITKSTVNKTEKVDKASETDHDILSQAKTEADRKVSHTYYIPPAPKLPDKTLLSEKEQMVSVAHIDVRDTQYLASESNRTSIDREDDYARQQLLNTRVLDIKDGKKYIREAPKIKDFYGGRIGRVSPKIRELQEQLRRSQYRQIFYDFYDNYYD